MGVKGVYSKPLCQHCGETEPSKFYRKMRTTCYSCHGKIQEQKRVQQRIDAINYKGGKCEHCGYDKYHGALEFHHKDPKIKDPKSFRPGLAKARFLAEVDKCLLLCANCHREEHARIRGKVAESGLWL
jgi:hypothetical protein